VHKWITTELKTARNHLMPRSSICLASIENIIRTGRRPDGKQIGTMNERTTAGVTSMSAAERFNGVAKILIQEGHGVRVHEIRKKSQKFLHKYNKLEKLK